MWCTDGHGYTWTYRWSRLDFFVVHDATKRRYTVTIGGRLSCTLSDKEGRALTRLHPRLVPEAIEALIMTEEL